MLNAEFNSSFSIPHSSLPLIRLVQQLQDRLAGGALPQEPAKRVLLEVGEDTVHRRQMLLWLVFGTEQQKDAVDRLVIQRCEIDAAGASADRAGHLADF